MYKTNRVKASPFVAGQVVLVCGSDASAYGGHEGAGWVAIRASYSAAWTYCPLNDVSLGRLFLWENSGNFQGLTTVGMDVMDPTKYAYPIFVGGARLSDNQEMVIATDGINCFAPFIASGSNSYMREPSCIHIPRCPTAQSKIVWILGGGGSGVDAYMQRSIDFGVSWTEKLYTALHGYQDGGGQGYRNTELKTFFSDYTDILALVIRSTELRGVESNHLISSFKRVGLKDQCKSTTGLDKGYSRRSG